MTGFEEVVAQILLTIYPDPLLWAFIFISFFSISLYLARSPASVTGLFTFLMIYTFNIYLGGVFEIANMIMLALVGVALILGLLKLGSR